MVARAREIVAQKGAHLMVEAAREGFEIELDPIEKKTAAKAVKATNGVPKGRKKTAKA